MDAISVYQLVLGFFFALAQSLLPLLPGLFFGLAVAYAMRHEAKVQYKARIDTLSKEVTAAKDGAQSELAVQQDITKDLRLRLCRAGRALKHARTEVEHYVGRVSELKEVAEHNQRTLETTTREMEAAQDLLRLQIRDVIDLRRQNEALKRDVADAQHDLRFATEEHEWTVYMYERQILDLQEELAMLKAEKGSVSAAEGLREAASFQLDDLAYIYIPRSIQDEAPLGSADDDLFYSTCDVQDEKHLNSTEVEPSCSTETLISAPHPVGGSHSVSLAEVRAYWSAVREESEQANPPLQSASSASLSDSSRSASPLTFLLERRPARVPVLLPMPSFSEFSDSAPLLLPRLHD